MIKFQRNPKSASTQPRKSLEPASPVLYCLCNAPSAAFIAEKMSARRVRDGVFEYGFTAFSNDPSAVGTDLDLVPASRFIEWRPARRPGRTLYVETDDIDRFLREWRRVRRDRLPQEKWRAVVRSLRVPIMRLVQLRVRERRLPDGSTTHVDSSGVRVDRSDLLHRIVKTCAERGATLDECYEVAAASGVGRSKYGDGVRVTRSRRLRDDVERIHAKAAARMRAGGR